MSYLLCHGFGFADNYWKNLEPFLDDDYEFWHEDFCPNPRRIYVGIGHSIGFLKLNNSGIKFKALIGLQGFLNFCGTDTESVNARKENLDRMIELCSQKTRDFLQFFYKACGYPEKIPEYISMEKLIADLNMMKFSYLHCGAPTLIVGSHSDKIVEPSILRNNFSCEKMVQLKYINGVPHNLGYSKPKETFDVIKNFLKHVSDE